MSKENICGKFYAFFVLRFTKGKVVLFVLRFTTFRFGDYTKSPNFDKGRGLRGGNVNIVGGLP